MGEGGGRWWTIVQVTKRLACTASFGAMLEFFRGVVGTRT